MTMPSTTSPPSEKIVAKDFPEVPDRYEVVTPGVIALPEQRFDLHLNQGTSESIKLCMYRGQLADISCINVTGDITLIDPTCLAVGDDFFILGESATRKSLCFTRPFFATVNAVSTDAKTITIDPTSLQQALSTDEIVCFPETTGDVTVPIGCIAPETTPQLDPPIVVQKITAENLTITGGILTRGCDYRYELGINTTATSNWAWTRILNKIQPGDVIKIEDAGISKYTRVLESHEVETHAGVINKIRLEDTPTSTGCYLGIVRRAVIIPITSRIDDDGCFEIEIDGAHTSGIQITGEKVNSADDGNCDDCEVCLGTYSISLNWFYAHPTTAKLVSRSQIVARGRAYMRPSHQISLQD